MHMRIPSMERYSVVLEVAGTCVSTYHDHVRNNYATYITAMRPYFSRLWQFRWLLCIATMNSPAQLQVQDGY